MAALGGGSLAAGGLGVTGGAVVLGSIIAFPAAAIGGLVFYGAGKKLARQEEDVSAQIKEAEDDFDARARCIRESFEWVTKAQAFLTLVLHRVANRLRTLDEIPLLRLGESDRPVAWAELSEDAQSILRELLDLAAVTISVLPLPVIATPDAGEPASKVEALERESREWNNAVLDLAMAWFAS